MTMLAPPKIQVELKVVPVLKTIVYAALAAEMVANMGMTDTDQINAIQQATADGLVDKIIVSGRRPDGGVDTFTLAMRPPNPGETIDLVLVPGKSMLETVDVGLAAGVKYAADLLKRRGLKPEFSVAWSAKVRANPSLAASAIQRLNLRAEPLPAPAPPPPMLPAYDMPVAPSPPPPVLRYPQTVSTYTGRPPIPATQVYTPVVTIKPAADSGLSFTHESSVPRT